MIEYLSMYQKKVIYEHKLTSLKYSKIDGGVIIWLQKDQEKNV